LGFNLRLEKGEFKKETGAIAHIAERHIVQVEITESMRLVLQLKLGLSKKLQAVDKVVGLIGPVYQVDLQLFHHVIAKLVLVHHGQEGKPYAVGYLMPGLFFFLPHILHEFLFLLGREHLLFRKTLVVGKIKLVDIGRKFHTPHFHQHHLVIYNVYHLAFLVRMKHKHLVTDLEFHDAKLGCWPQAASCWPIAGSCWPCRHAIDIIF
jgi:hypothetical protein